MDIIHIEVRYTEIFNLSKELLEILPKKIILFTTIQYFNSLDNFLSQLESHGIEVKLIKPRHTEYAGQILGCSNAKVSEDEDFLYIGDGLFHPRALLLKNEKKVYTYNPKSEEINVFDEKFVEKLKKQLYGKYVRFLSSKNIGVLITTKSGQCKYKLTENLKKDFPDKNFYFFLDNTYNFNSLKDFNFIDMFLNTMCERIGYDDSDVQDISILNVEDLYELKNNS
ncbi:MAG: diphthamide synthesis protein [Candidatus Woesearchaeota archaeon]